MLNLYAALFAGVLAFGITLIELLTSEYPRTCNFLFKKSWKLYLYSIIYGAIAFVFMLLLMLLDSGIIKLEGLGISNIWIQAILVGMSTKAILHIRFFSATIGSESFPIGIETILQVFEPWLLTEIKLEEFNAVKEFISNAETKYSNLEVVKAKIMANIPSISDKDKVIFKLDLDAKTTVSEAMELYLKKFGKKSFVRIFPT